MLHAPPRAHIVHSISSFAVAVDILGGYNWRHRGDFSISTFNPLNGPTLFQNLRKKSFNFLGFGGGLEVGWGVDGGWMSLPTSPQRYCDPASLVRRDVEAFDDFQFEGCDSY